MDRPGQHDAEPALAFGRKTRADCNTGQNPLSKNAGAGYVCFHLAAVNQLDVGLLLEMLVAE